jgi:pseudouridine-5'-phosphate glycosidase
VCYRSDVFPAFWSRDSGLPAPLRLDSVDDIAMMIQVRNALGLRGGTVIGNPVPEASEISRSRMDRLVEEALADARKAGVTGKAITPFLLQRIYELSDGDSLDTNIALVHNNATLGAHLANRLAVK